MEIICNISARLIGSPNVHDYSWNNMFLNRLWSGLGRVGSRTCLKAMFMSLKFSQCVSFLSNATPQHFEVVNSLKEYTVQSNVRNKTGKLDIV